MSETDQKTLTAWAIDGALLDIRPAPVDRDWMEATPQRYAYRCLPLNIANAHGWEVLCPSGFAIGWTGGADNAAVVIQADPGTTAPAVSHFGQGIFTFHIHALIRTQPGYDLWVQGPVNRPKDGVYPLTGVVETDWMPFTFTMNWKFTRPGVLLRFEKGEPFCHIFPVRRGELEQFHPVLADITDNPQLKADFDTWSASRNGFNADLKQPGSEARKAGWQKTYYRGVDAEGRPVGADDHRTRVRLRPFLKPGESEPEDAE